MFKNVTLTHKNNTLLNKHLFLSFCTCTRRFYKIRLLVYYIFLHALQKIQSHQLYNKIYTIHIIKSELITHTELMKRINDHVKIFRAMCRHSTFINCSS